MSDDRIQDLLRETAQLPRYERNRLHRMLDQMVERPAARDRAVPAPEQCERDAMLLDHGRQYGRRVINPRLARYPDAASNP
jgi:hypothetical protein